MAVSRSPRTIWRPAGFTLVELLVASAILILILAIVFSITTQISGIWRGTNNKITAFQNARAAFEGLTRSINQATLNSYYDYYDSSWNLRPAGSTNFVPSNYGRRSELEYISGPVDQLFSGAGSKLTHSVFFQAPTGYVSDTNYQMESSSLMSALGFYVEYAGASKYDQLPRFLRSQAQADRPAFRLVEWLQPAEKLGIYDPSQSPTNRGVWYTAAVASGTQSRVVADNIVALVIAPKSTQTDTTLAPTYFYDSSPATYDQARSHLLPPLLQVTMVAIDEDSAARLRRAYPNTTPPLTTGLFQQASQYDSDLTRLKSILNGETGGPKLNYRVFSTTIDTRERK